MSVNAKVVRLSLAVGASVQLLIGILLLFVYITRSYLLFSLGLAVLLARYRFRPDAWIQFSFLVGLFVAVLAVPLPFVVLGKSIAIAGCLMRGMLEKRPSGHVYTLRTLDWIALLWLSFLAIQSSVGVLRGHAIYDVGTALFVLGQPVMYFLLGRYFGSMSLAAFGRELFWVNVPLVIFNLSKEGLFLARRYPIGGYISHLIVLLGLPGVGSGLWDVLRTLVLLIDVFAAGVRRYMVAVLIGVAWYAVVRHRVVVVVVGIMAFLGALWSLGLQELRITDPLGWRISEGGIAVSFLGEGGWIIGQGLGRQIDEVFIPRRGIIELGPSFHNYYVTILWNVGLVGALIWLVFWIMSVVVLWRLTRKDKTWSGLLGLFLGWSVVAFFDAPPDGHWLLGLIPAIAVNHSMGWSERVDRLHLIGAQGPAAR